MSGSGGGGTVGGVSGGGAGRPCEQVRLIRNLEGPVQGVVDALVVGDKLEVVLHDGPPQLVTAVTHDGQTAGAILPTGQLIDCLKRGFRFEAEVMSHNGGAVQIEVRAKL